MHRRIGELAIDPMNIGGYDNVLVEIDDSENPAILKVSFFKEGHYQDEVTVALTVDDSGIYTDAEMWKRRCLELAADLDYAERALAKKNAKRPPV